jgi:hypothetical protein
MLDMLELGFLWRAGNLLLYVSSSPEGDSRITLSTPNWSVELGATQLGWPFALNNND